MLGKKVINNLYWHSCLTSAQPNEVQLHVAEAENLIGLHAGIDYNVIKYDIKGQALSLLWYPCFFTDAFPVLEKSYRIDRNSMRVEKRNFHASLNPPILHRKELLLSLDDPHISQFKELTAIAEQLGLFENTLRIGFKQAWDNLIAEKGFQLIDNQFVPIGNVEAHDGELLQDPSSTSNTTIARHLTALSRSNLSAPIQCLARHGFLDGTFSVFDYGCGKGDDIRNLTANAIPVSGWDPHYAADQPKQLADLVNLGFVINVIESYQERLEALIGAYSLTRHVLVVSAMLINQNAFKFQTFNDGVIFWQSEQSFWQLEHRFWKKPEKCSA